MSTLVLERPSATPIVPAVRTSPKPQPDPFEGRPLARALHNAGITVLSKRSVRRQQRRYKEQCIRDYVAGQLKSSYPETEPPSEEFLLTSARMGTRWEVFPLEYYRLLSTGELSSAETAMVQAPVIPAEADEVIEEIQARVPGVCFEVEALHLDPYIAAKLGEERLYVWHF